MSWPAYLTPQLARGFAGVTGNLNKPLMLLEVLSDGHLECICGTTLRILCASAFA